MAYRGTATAFHDRTPPRQRTFRGTRDTFIENEPQSGFEQLPVRAKLVVSSPALKQSYSPTSGHGSTSDTSSFDVSSLWSQRQSSTDNDSLYNLTDDESVEVPLTISASLKRSVATKEKVRYPSLIIPSPSAWPMPPSLQKFSPCSIGMSPIANVAIPPGRLAALATNKYPSRTSTPSLDGSLTSEELAASSCPSTPDLAVANDEDGRWSPPIQLDPSVVQTLHHIHPDLELEDEPSRIIEISSEEVQEMQELVKDAPLKSRLVPGFRVPTRNPSPAGTEPMSALSVPSPGGFFASLNGSARLAWSLESSGLPNTSVAERFYGVPWRSSSPPKLDTELPPVPPIPSQYLLQNDSQPVATGSSPTEQVDLLEITDVTFEYDNHYEDDLKRIAMANADRTKLWLNSQNLYLATISGKSTLDTPRTPLEQLQSCFSPDTPDTVLSLRTSLLEDSPSKKSVRFLTSIPEAAEAGIDDLVLKTEPIFFQGFRYLSSRQQRLDAFRHRQIRVEAAHVQSASLTQKHCNQLRGDFEVNDVDRPAPKRPVSSFLPDEAEDEQKHVIATAERERQALEQIMPACWELKARQQVFGTQLITSPAISNLKRGPGAKILDFGGQAACDWAWEVALEHRGATVYTATNECDATKPAIEGPFNHRIVTLSSIHSLPFPENHFDIISARSLHALLKTSNPPSNPQTDEYILVLAELHRVLKPGGYLEFSLLDAELLHPQPLAHALSVEFAFNLRTLGYDPCASKTFLPRLRRAGFDDVKRAWMLLPCADVTPRWVDEGKCRLAPLGAQGSTSAKQGLDDGLGAADGVAAGTVDGFVPPLTGSTGDVRALTGLVGARAWQKWMLKLQREMGGSEEKLLERMSCALEESGKEKAGWRCLMGWARKME